MPAAPTFAEAGLPAFNLTPWQGILAPAATPKPIIDKLSAEIAKTLQTPDMHDKLLSLGVPGWSMARETFAVLIRSDIDTFAKVVKTAQVKTE